MSEGLVDIQSIILFGELRYVIKVKKKSQSR